MNKTNIIITSIIINFILNMIIELTSRCWLFTILNPLDDDFQNIPHKYMIWQLEQDNNLQLTRIVGYVIFEYDKTFLEVKYLFPINTWLEMKISKNHKRYISYCMKDTTRIDGPILSGFD